MAQSSARKQVFRIKRTDKQIYYVSGTTQYHWTPHRWQATKCFNMDSVLISMRIIHINEHIPFEQLLIEKDWE